jgi:hypothetical protein
MNGCINDEELFSIINEMTGVNGTTGAEKEEETTKNGIRHAEGEK